MLTDLPCRKAKAGEKDYKLADAHSLLEALMLFCPLLHKPGNRLATERLAQLPITT